MHATLLALTTPSCAQPLSWNLVLGNFHRFSNVISIKYSNVLLKCKTQLTEIKISRKGEEEEWEWQRESGMRGVPCSTLIESFHLHKPRHILGPIPHSAAATAAVRHPVTDSTPGARRDVLPQFLITLSPLWRNGRRPLFVLVVVV